MTNVNFLGLTDKKPETAGSIAFISTPKSQPQQLFTSVPETAGSIASNSSSASSGSSSGSSTMAVA